MSRADTKTSLDAFLSAAEQECLSSTAGISSSSLSSDGYGSTSSVSDEFVVESYPKQEPGLLASFHSSTTPALEPAIPLDMPVSVDAVPVSVLAPTSSTSFDVQTSAPAALPSFPQPLPPTLLNPPVQVMPPTEAESPLLKPATAPAATSSSHSTTESTPLETPAPAPAPARPADEPTITHVACSFIERIATRDGRVGLNIRSDTQYALLKSHIVSTVQPSRVCSYLDELRRAYYIAFVRSRTPCARRRAKLDVRGSSRSRNAGGDARIAKAHNSLTSKASRTAKVFADTIFVDLLPLYLQAVTRAGNDVMGLVGSIVQVRGVTAELVDISCKAYEITQRYRDLNSNGGANAVTVAVEEKARVEAEKQKQKKLALLYAEQSVDETLKKAGVEITPKTDGRITSHAAATYRNTYNALLHSELQKHLNSIETACDTLRGLRERLAVA